MKLIEALNKAYNDGFLDGSKELADRVNPCPWCDGDDHEIAYLGDTESISIWMEGNKLSAYGDGEVVCYIGYCPNCGRKLEGERNNMESERKTISPIENELSQYEEKLRMAREEAETLYYCEHRGEEGYE